MEEWVVQIEEQLRNIPTPAIPRKDRFYRVPADVREGQDPPVFDPVKISIGPYHHGSQLCEPGECLKKQCLLHFLKRTNKPFQDLIVDLKPTVDKLTDVYDQLNPDWLKEEKMDAFLQMIILDSCFLLEIMLEDREQSYFDPAFFSPNDMDNYRHDMLLLENQIPLKVLVALASIIYPDERKRGAYRFLKRLILEFFSLPHALASSRPESLHVLDVYRGGLLYSDLYLYRMTDAHVGLLVKSLRRLKKKSSTFRRFNIPSATELRGARIGIRTSKTQSLMDISFSRRTLRLPQIHVRDTTKSIFHNVILFERFHPQKSEPSITSYIYFMSSLLHGAEDSSHLRLRGIIKTALADEQVTKLFQDLCKSIVSYPDETTETELLVMGRKLRERYNKNSEPWKKELYQNLRSPWAIISVIAAVVIFSLAAIQTVYTVLSYYTHS